ncbi:MULTISPECIES: alpha/beta fold hydrolase [Haloferax]|uniref:Alpha/beta fold hydrolase n=1 Tax=Haloferax marinum TaxID=2666143 RepID=A0A6A8G6J5_9EURY|nr:MULTISPECIES: alpha/beta hydrolase [Haloferax]KAB1197209.1 alpha/beta hydrolase [Haloferax sp. CBA1150]MRW96248.1 alpha/beta fold hydrolase [Haloferax marinum]
MSRNWTRWLTGAGILLGVASGALWRWQQRLLADLAAGSELVETEHGTIEVATRGSGYPVLVLHGTPGGYDQALFAGEAMFDGVQVIAPSRPGFLRTPLTDDGSPRAEAALLDALLDDLDVEETLVVGISGGGPAALQLAAEYPERVSGLILGAAVTIETESRTYGVPVHPLVDPILTSAPALALRSGVFGLLQRFAPDRLIEITHSKASTLEGDDLEAYVAFVTSNPEHRQRFLDMVSTVRPAGARVEGTLNDERWFEHLPLADYGAIECPVLVLHGEFDAPVPMTHATFVAERVPDAELVRLEGDHFLMVGPDAERGGEAIQRFSESIIATSEQRTV